MTTRLATVFGGSGFVGRHLVQRLVGRGWRVRVAVRAPGDAAFLQPLGDVGQVVPLFADITSRSSVDDAVDGAQWVINAVGILTERGRASFQSIHVDGAANIAAAAKAAGVGGLAQISAIGRRCAVRGRLCPQQGGGGSGRPKPVSRGGHSSSQRGLRPRGRFPQPFRRHDRLQPPSFPLS